MKNEWIDGKEALTLISYDFEYYLPSSIKEAVHLFEELQGKERIPFIFRVEPKSSRLED